MHQQLSLGGASKYAQVSAAVRALRSDMLVGERFEKFVRTSNFAEALNILAETRRDLPITADADAQNVERVVLQDLVRTITKLASYCPPDCGKLITQFMKGRELECLKTLMRATAEDLDPEQIIHTIVPVRNFTLEVCRNLLQSRNMGRIAESIPDENLRRAVGGAIGAGKAIDEIEALIDAYGYLRTWAASKFSTYEDMSSTRMLLGEAVDIHNLLQVVRSQTLGLPASSIKGLLVPLQFHLGPTLVEAAESGSTVNSLRAFEKTAYGSVISPFANSFKEGESLYALEVSLKRHHAKRCAAVFQGFPFVPALPVAFTYLKGYELGDLITILNGKRDGLSEDGIRSSLILN